MQFAFLSDFSVRRYRFPDNRTYLSLLMMYVNMIVDNTILKYCVLERMSLKLDL